MERARKVRAVTATALASLALALPVAVARAEVAGTNDFGNATLEEPTQATPLTPEPVQQGETLAPPVGPKEEVEETPEKDSEAKADEGGEEADGGGVPATKPQGIVPPSKPGAALAIPSLPTSSCAATGVPQVLIPIYQRASNAYALGPQGPAVLAGINEIETGFGSNLGPSYAGAEGWMQFMPATWAAYGVDADDDGVADPDNPEDAIFAAASYLSASGMPADTYGAIFAYNHADWYVQEVLANASCYAQEVGGPGITPEGLKPKIQVFKCTPSTGFKDQIPPIYMRAFEDAAARYELGERGVWTLAAVARLESEYGKGMTKQELKKTGPLGLDATEWSKFAVDGDEDGKIRRSDPVDSAATLARLIWSRGSVDAGVFSHNQAEWYVEEVNRQAEEMTGKCRVRYADWALAPLDTGFETPGAQAVLIGNMASAPKSAPPAIKAVIAAANSIAHTPYVWGGGHGSWYSYGYDCSGAVSYALHGAGLLETPLVSGSLESYGEPGPGKWITIYANAGHTYMTVAGLRWDTAGNAGTETGPRWHLEPPYPEGFVVRHPTGY